MSMILLRQLIQEAIQARLDEAPAVAGKKPAAKKAPKAAATAGAGKEPSEQAKEMGLHYGGFGRWFDEAGQYVADTEKGHLVKRAQNDEWEEHGLDAKTEKFCNNLFKKAGQKDYNPKGLTHPSPGWNKGMKWHEDDIAFDAHAEETVKILLAKVGDPRKLVNWMVRKFQEETPNGKKRMLQYLGVLKDMGVLDQEQAAQAANPTAEPKKAPAKKGGKDKPAETPPETQQVVKPSTVPSKGAPAKKGAPKTGGKGIFGKKK